MTAWGFAGGAGVGLTYVVLLFALWGSGYLIPIASVIGFLVGGLLGGPLGLVDGFVLAGITHLALRRRVKPRSYRALVYCVSALLTITGALLGLSVFFSASWDLSEAQILYVLIPSLIAAVVAVIATVRVVRWVEKSSSSLLSVE
jgi:hypothetical protein